MKIAISAITSVAFLTVCFLVSARGQALEFDQPVERELAAGQAHSYDLQLAAGQFLKVEVQFKGFAGVIAVFGPDNRTLVETRSGGDLTSQQYVALIVPVDGRYRLEARSSEKNAGRYRLLVVQPRAATEADRHYALAQRAFDEANGLFEKGTAESRRQAVAKFQESLPEWRATGDQRREAETQHSVATIWKMLGENRQALPVEQEAPGAGSRQR
jgi:hypothetical protein